MAPCILSDLAAVNLGRKWIVYDAGSQPDEWVPKQVPGREHWYSAG